MLFQIFLLYLIIAGKQISNVLSEMYIPPNVFYEKTLGIKERLDREVSY